jgi:hypothetical protein
MKMRKWGSKEAGARPLHLHLRVSLKRRTLRSSWRESKRFKKLV